MIVRTIGGKEMMKLRPIGTEFWYEFPADEHSTDPTAHRIKYKVVEHIDVEEPYRSGRWAKAERWEAVAVEPLIKE